MLYFPLPSHPLDVIVLIIFCEKYKFFKLPMMRCFLQASSLVHFLLRLLLYEHLLEDDRMIIIKNRLRVSFVHLFVCVVSSFSFYQGRILSVIHD